MIRTFRIKEYNGKTGASVANTDQDPESLHKPGLNMVCSVLTYGLHDGLASVAEEHVRKLLENHDQYLLVARNELSRRADGSGEIVGCACMAHLRSLRWTSMRVTDFAIKSHPTHAMEAARALLSSVIRASQALGVNCLIFECTPPQLLQPLLHEQGFKLSSSYRPLIVFSSAPGVPKFTKRKSISFGETEERLDL